MVLVGDKQQSGEVPFSARAAQMLMAIASSETPANTNNFAFLPNSWAACHDLAILAKRKQDTFDAAIAAGGNAGQSVK